jgi:hypothetical protein
MSPRERRLWAQEWARPQAIMWDLNHQAVEVALYIRALIDSEMPNAPVSLRALVNRLMGSLGLTVDGLLRNHWIIEQEPEAPRDGRTASTARRPSAKYRVIDGGAAS